MPQTPTTAALEAEETTLKAPLTPPHLKILAAAHGYCRAVTQNHYENFPVASLLLPKNLRPAVEAIYAFARTADDFADEKEYKEVRLKKLDEWESFLNDDSRPTHPVFIALHDAIENHGLSPRLFSDLITAFRMDVHKKRHENFNQVLNYCRYSANPVGRLILKLFKQDTNDNLFLSDYICTGLQLANFWQDIAVDLTKDRIYLPLDELEKFNITPRDLINHKTDDAFRMLMNYQVERTRAIFLKGKPLGLNLPGRLGLEIRLTWLGGMTILKKIKAAHYDVFNKRPGLTKRDFLKLFFTAASKKRYEWFTI